MVKNIEQEPDNTISAQRQLAEMAAKGVTDPYLAMLLPGAARLVEHDGGIIIGQMDQNGTFTQQEGYPLPPPATTEK